MLFHSVAWTQLSELIILSVFNHWYQELRGHPDGWDWLLLHWTAECCKLKMFQRPNELFLINTQLLLNSFWKLGSSRTRMNHACQEEFLLDFKSIFHAYLDVFMSRVWAQTFKESLWFLFLFWFPAGFNLSNIDFYWFCFVVGDSPITGGVKILYLQACFMMLMQMLQI